MSVPEQVREALHDFWMGGKLPAGVAAVLFDPPADASGVARRQEYLAVIAGLADESLRRTRRLALSFGPLAMAKLVELVRAENAETCRKAAVDLLKRMDEAQRQERAEQAAQVTRQEGLLAASVSEEESRRILAILADAAGRVPRGEMAAEAVVIEGPEVGEEEQAEEE